MPGTRASNCYDKMTGARIRGCQSQPMDQMGVVTCEQLFCEAGETIGRPYTADDRATIICSFLGNGPMRLFKENKNKKQTLLLQPNAILVKAL